jgi:hypothetical protein
MTLRFGDDRVIAKRCHTGAFNSPYYFSVRELVPVTSQSVSTFARLGLIGRLLLSVEVPVKIAVIAVRFDFGEESPLCKRGRRGDCRASGEILWLVGRLQAL